MADACPDAFRSDARSEQDRAAGWMRAASAASLLRCELLGFVAQRCTLRRVDALDDILISRHVQQGWAVVLWLEVAL